jgi:hypothetical protein
MRVVSSQVSLEARHALQKHTETKESLRAWVGSERPDFEGTRRSEPSVVVRISAEGAAATNEATCDPDANQDGLDAQLSLLRWFVEKLTGKRMQVFDASELSSAGATPSRSNEEAPAAPAGFGVELDVTRIYSEQEQMQFTAKGTLRTQDGATLHFELKLSASRSYQRQESLSLRAGDAPVRKDPLVLNFSGTAPALSEARFRFDIDADGTAEELPMLAEGNAFLALDINANGQIDSGAELFGARSGDGFADLAAYDEDHNRVIDENDAVFARLRIFVPTQDNSAATLATLKERGVGALLLDHIETPFTLRTNNAELGAVRATGVYLTESGEARAMQQIDLVV